MKRLVYSQKIVLTVFAFCLLLAPSPALPAWPYFADDFNDGQLKEEWVVNKKGGLLSETLGRLEMLFRAGAKGNPFWAALCSKQGLYVKPYSSFIMTVKYNLLRWPRPANGIRLGLRARIFNNSGKETASYCAAVISDPDFITDDNPNGEVLAAIVNGVAVDTEKATSKRGTLRVERDYRTGFKHMRILAYGPDYMGIDYAKKPLASEDIGKVGWELVAWGHDWKYTGPVKVAFDNFEVESQKGFLETALPPTLILENPEQ
jgi:hypothetical protein